MQPPLEYPVADRLTGRIPLWLKVAYTLFAVVFVVVQLRVTPALLLWFCNAAIVIILVGIWMESRLLLSTQLLAIVWPHVIWQIDYFGQTAFDLKVFAICGLTPAEYMFNPDYPFIRRCLSFQHAWLLYLLLWLVWRVGYDFRALRVQTLYTLAVLPITAIVVRDMHGPAGNVNYVFGPSNTQPQSWMLQWAWVACLMVLLPLCQYAPLHGILCWLFRGQKGVGRS